MWARMRRFGELALDTPALALDVRAYYARQGFVVVGGARLAGRDYDSVVMSKSISLEPRTPAGVVRRATELAALAREANDPGLCPLH